MDTLSLAAWGAHDSRLVASCVLALLFIILTIGWLKLSPFLSILIGAFLGGFAAGLPLEGISGAFTKGAGGLLGDIGVVIALGAMLGAVLSETGAADRLASGMLARTSSPRALPWMMMLVALIIGLPLFFEVGLVVMAPLIFATARKSGQPVLRIAIPALAGMTALHALLPPHPGPLIAIGVLHAELGLTLGLGLLIALPAVVLAGPVYGGWLSRRIEAGDPKRAAGFFGTHEETGAPPPFALCLAIILLPVLLMLGRTVARLGLAKGSPLYDLLDFLGEPIIALGLTVVLGVVAFGWARKVARQRMGEVLAHGLPPIASLLLTIGAGGGLKQILVTAGMSETLGKIAAGSHLSPVVLAWLVAVALRQATGSATVATATTAGLLVPLAAHLGLERSSLLALSIGAGSVFFCHVNDAGFWMVKEYFGLQLRQTVLVWSVLQTIVSVTGLVLTSLLWIFAS